MDLNISMGLKDHRSSGLLILDIEIGEFEIGTKITFFSFADHG